MSQLNFHDEMRQVKTPPQGKLPSVLQKTKEAYALWLIINNNLPKTIRLGIGTRIENHFINLLEDIYIAAYTPREQKLRIIIGAIKELDLLKFILQILWENKYLKDARYGELSEYLFVIGKMLAGWAKSLEPTR